MMWFLLCLVPVVLGTITIFLLWIMGDVRAGM
jgi:hypothetical protein